MGLNGYSILNDVGGVALAPVTGGASLYALGSDKNPLDTAGDVKKKVQELIQGPAPTDPNKTPAGKQASGVETSIIGQDQNFTPGTAPTAGRDPAAQAAIATAQQAQAQAQAAYDAAAAAAAKSLGVHTGASYGVLGGGDTTGTAAGAAVAASNPDVQNDPSVKAAKAALDKATSDVQAAQNAYDRSIDPGLLTTPQTIAAPPTVTAPTISAPTIGPAAPTAVATVDPNSVPTVSGGNYSYNPALIDPNSVPNAVAGSATGGGVTAQQIDPNAGKVAPVADIDISGTTGRQAQLQALELDRTAATGSAPSAAQILMQQGIDSAVGAGYGLAASLQGRNPGLALRQGVSAASDTALKGAAQSAALRATEMADARGAFGTLATQIAAGDIQVAQSNQTKNLQIAITDANNKLDALKANQTANLNAGIATAANETAASIATLQAKTTVDVANMNKSVAIDTANQTAANDASKANAANQLAAATTDAVNKVSVIMQNMKNAQDANDRDSANALAIQLQQAQDELATAQSNQKALLEASQTNATNQTNTNLTQATLNSASSQGNANRQLAVSQGNQQAQLSEQQLNQAYQLGLNGQALSASSLGLQTQAQYDAAQQAYNAGLSQLIIGGGKIAAGAGGGGAAGAGAGGAGGITYGANGSPILA